MWHRLFKLDAKQPQSLQSQLRQALVKAILDNRIPVDVPLPSSRELSRQLGVARNTVVLAYQHLVDENYLLAHERRGYFVNPEILDGRVESTKPEPLPANAGFEFAEGPDVTVDLLAQRNIQRPLDWQRYPYPFIYGQVDCRYIREFCRVVVCGLIAMRFS